MFFLKHHFLGKSEMSFLFDWDREIILDLQILAIANADLRFYLLHPLNFTSFRVLKDILVVVRFFPIHTK